MNRSERNFESVGALRTTSDSEFQMEGATFVKDLSPSLTWQVRGKRRRLEEKERRETEL